ncbi:hypothetical protein P167DRAFT_159550 [Morchella conica CCBAS932]|uniref:Uncharacterized protein n=1 Tax=Morchella conica CCBAS932 TaxID=1392247 RepID=A0A3N4KSP0_9PEZI|nr:hypothetical protein P167DRAFT_159550 [Morchella conica CCBAS932]
MQPALPLWYKKKDHNEASPFIKEASNEAGLLSLAPLYRHPLPGCLPESRCCFARAGSSVVLHNCCCCWLLLLLLSLLLSLHRCICAAAAIPAIPAATPAAVIASLHLRCWCAAVGPLRLSSQSYKVHLVLLRGHFLCGVLACGL